MKKQFTLLLLLTFSMLSAQVPQSERDALIDFYNALNGSNWSNNANQNWNTSQPVNTWYGITTEVIGGVEHVTRIILYRYDLQGSIPASIGDLVQLKTLSLSGNSISGTIPAEIGNLTQLENLYLRFNQLSGTIPAELGNLTQLEALYLSSNQLTGTIPVELGNLISLEYLYLSNNFLSGALPDFSNLNDIKDIRIYKNNFHFADFENQFTALQTACQNNGGNFYYNSMNRIDTEDVYDMVAGNNYTFTMSTINGTGVTYQWYKNDLEIAGATSNTLTINNAQQSDLGDYTCKASSPIVTDLQIERNTIHLYGTVNPTDRAALVALYNATNGANWTDNTNWNTANKVYTWYGVSMVGDRVSKIDLRGNNLDGTIPPEIGDLIELKSLILNVYGSTCNIHGTIPPEIGNLTNLEELIINFANLSGNIPVEIGNCTALKELELWHNQLTGTIPNELGNLVNLELITLEYNQLTGTIPASFANCTKMGSFWLNGNQLTGDVPDIFTNMPDLYYVSLFSNQLTGNVDLSNNPAVYGIWMGNLLLSSIDLRNGGNTNISAPYLRNNPNLTCIFVDDAAYSTANWTNIDATTTFVETQAQCDALSVNDELENIINIYPNPTNGILNLDIPAEITIRNISIQSITGQVVQKLNAKDLRVSSSRFDISQLPKGVYFVQIETQKGELANYRIIKE